MKFLVVLALAAVAAAEPEAESFYGTYGSYMGYSGYSPLTTTYAGAYSPYTTGAYSTYSPYMYNYGHRYVKREADAEAEPIHHYTYPYAGVHTPYTTAYTHSPMVYNTAGVIPYSGYAGVVAPAIHRPYVFAPKNVAVQKAEGAPKGYKAFSAGVAHVVNKREAEADADSYFNYGYNYPSVYGSYGVPASTYTAGVYSAAYNRPYSTYTGAYSPYYF